ncbi:hypothetical protein BOTBODRAFT_33906 [Botryobasidium botryosum FD-172 SS1]|uniref:Acyl-protein thioesterase 1 n=1 Tax=Botryobasidium botryosum (strain FD-172 SS1) TaxID=930990 RepID=A0A067MMA9_BOTB1|nr:hypothetical protein BOTBODRAFT_33906 [Botryobasidium botryosum FD-172 SS1]
MASLKFLTVAPRARHTATVVFIHGLGDTGAGWSQVAEMLGSQLPHIKFILPTAPIRPITVNRGMTMNAWYDVTAVGGDIFNAPDDGPGVRSSARLLNELITAEVDGGIDSKRVVVGGFSQGGAMALFTGLTAERELGGIIALSSRLPLRKEILAMVSDNARKLPLFFGHGDSDLVVPYALGQLSVKLLTEGGFAAENIEFNTYSGMGHSAIDEEIADVAKWLKKVVPAP